MAEINNTVQENMSPIGSVIICSVIGVEAIGMRLHSISLIELVHIALTVTGKRMSRVDHIRRVADLKKIGRAHV